MKRCLTSVLLAVTLGGCHGAAPGSSVTRDADGPVTRIPAGRGAFAVALADLNRDRRLDLVVANQTGNDAIVFHGDGAGGLARAPIAPLPTGPMPNDIALGDFDRDGQIDLAFPNHETSFVTVLLARGGGFAPAPRSPFDTGSRPHVHSLVAGDVDGDGLSDLAVESVDTDSVIVLAGDGRGGFGSPMPFFAGRRPYFRIGIGDVNGDGRQDLAAPNSGGNTISVLTADGRGGLVPAAGSPYTAGTGPDTVVIGDVDGDGRSDLVVLHFNTSSVTVLLGGEAGTFRPAPGSPFPVGRDPNNVALGDVDGDGVLDLAVSNLSSDDVTLLLSAGRRAPGSATQRVAVGRRPQGVALGDLNGDGRADMVVANSGDDDVSVWLSR